MLPAQPRQAKDDLGRGRAAKDAIGVAVGRGRMADHGEAGFARLEGLGLFVLGGLGTPPPVLMHIGAVRRVHQPDHGMVDMGVEGHPVDQLGPAADHAGEDRRRLIRLRLAARVRAHPDKDQALAFVRGIMAHADARHIHRLVLDQRGDGRADPVGAVAPAVIGAFDQLGAVLALDQPSGRQRRGAVGTDVAHGVDLAGAGAAQQDRLAEDLIALQPARPQVAGQGGEIPDVAQEALAEDGLGLARLELACADFAVALGHDGCLARNRRPARARHRAAVAMSRA